MRISEEIGIGYQRLINLYPRDSPAQECRRVIADASLEPWEAKRLVGFFALGGSLTSRLGHGPNGYAAPSTRLSKIF